MVSKNGIETDKKKIEATTNWPIPLTVTDVRSFLGFTNYCRWFIPNYAHIVRPLNLLTSGENASKKMADWNEECQQALNRLSDLCNTTHVLAFAYYSKPFKVHTDASGLGRGLCCMRLKGMNLTE